MHQEVRIFHYYDIKLKIIINGDAYEKIVENCCELEIIQISYFFVEYEWLFPSFSSWEVVEDDELAEEAGGICGLNVDEYRPFLW